jgi:hypothetical protein
LQSGGGSEEEISEEDGDEEEEQSEEEEQDEGQRAEATEATATAVPVAADEVPGVSLVQEQERAAAGLALLASGGKKRRRGGRSGVKADVAPPAKLRRGGRGGRVAAVGGRGGGTRFQCIIRVNDKWACQVAVAAKNMAAAYQLAGESRHGQPTALTLRPAPVQPSEMLLSWRRSKGGSTCHHRAPEWDLL